MWVASKWRGTPCPAISIFLKLPPQNAKMLPKESRGTFCGSTLKTEYRKHAFNRFMNSSSETAKNCCFYALGMRRWRMWRNCKPFPIHLWNFTNAQWEGKGEKNGELKSSHRFYSFLAEKVSNAQWGDMFRKRRFIKSLQLDFFSFFQKVPN